MHLSIKPGYYFENIVLFIYRFVRIFVIIYD